MGRQATPGRRASPPGPGPGLEAGAGGWGLATPTRSGGLKGGGAGELTQSSQSSQQGSGDGRLIDALERSAPELHLVLEPPARLGDERSQLPVTSREQRSAESQYPLHPNRHRHQGVEDSLSPAASGISAAGDEEPSGPEGPLTRPELVDGRQALSEPAVYGHRPLILRRVGERIGKGVGNGEGEGKGQLRWEEADDSHRQPAEPLEGNGVAG